MQALSQMDKTRTSRLMVVQDGHLAGIIALKDMLKFIALKVELENDTERLRQLPLEDDG
jgi:signal-transduction protein with cAMP-binding, CBS, and nucleotidyltransferase domain